jgi:rare lipoprotein A
MNRFGILIAILFLSVCFSAQAAPSRNCQALQAPGSADGVASWYGDEFNGSLTANGETFNDNEMTAAHLGLPFGSLVLVTYQGQSVIVRINDAGPYYGDRIIDLSKEAARRLGMLDEGVGSVHLDLIQCGE